jgi:Xaa-Pro aminopeptidase
MSKAVSKEAVLRALVQSSGLDALVLMSPENFAYGSGLHIITVNMIRPRQAFLIVPKSGEIEMVLCSVEVSLAKQEGWVETIHPYTEFVDHPMDMLAARLTALGIADGKIGIDTDYLPVSSHEQLMRNLPGVKLNNTPESVAAIRAIKAPDEVSIL